MNIHKQLTAAFPFLGDYDAFDEFMPGREHSWLNDLRLEAIERFKAIELPSRRQEDWKYTDLRSLAETPFALASEGSNTSGLDRLPSPLGPRLVFNNGYLDQELSNWSHLPDGVYFASVSETLKHAPELIRGHLEAFFVSNSESLSTLNLAFMMDGYVLALNQSVRVATPFEVVFVGGANKGPTSIHPRSFIMAAPGSAASLVETHVSSMGDPYWSNSVTQTSVGAGAEIRCYKQQSEGSNSYHLSHFSNDLGEEAEYEFFLLNHGAKLSRNTLNTTLLGSNSVCRLGGAYLISGNQHSDITTTVEHKVPHGKSAQAFYGVLDGHSHGVFQGKIAVTSDAQKTDAYQTNKALMLSELSEIDAKPELEIFADDVKCSHGVTTGELDRDALFYLRARGIDESVARRMLIEAFLTNSIDQINVAAIRERFLLSAVDWIAQ